jgi:uncharacterized protein YndB with AHSA1/START domain
MFPQALDKSVEINAESSKVWETLISPGLMKLWLSESNIQVYSEWKEGSDFIMKGDLHGIAFENRGSIIQLEAPKIFGYNYLSNISGLPDAPGNRTHVRFSLSEQNNNQTLLQLSLKNFPTESIYRHIDFYWNATLLEIKKVAENLKD